MEPVKRKKMKSECTLSDQQLSWLKSTNQGRIVSNPDQDRCLDTVQLNRLEQSFRDWAQDSPRLDVRFSRRRILIIFLLIRYTGAKLSEVLNLNPLKDMDRDGQLVYYGKRDDKRTPPRAVQISEVLSREINEALSESSFSDSMEKPFAIDPGFVRRKFYERSESCGFPRRLGAPEMIRRARAVELMQSNMPLPAVQMMLGHSTPNLTSSYVSFSGDEIQQVVKAFMERESSRKTSARNAFFGKVLSIQQGDIQAVVKLITLGGYPVTTVITNESLKTLGLTEGSLVGAEVKAPWVMLGRGEDAPACSAENRFDGVVSRITRGRITTEYAVRIADGTELCVLMSREGDRSLGLKKGDRVWAYFNCFSVVLHLA